MKGIDFIADLNYLTSDEGGRTTPATSGYRPHVEFEGYPDMLTSGEQKFIGVETVSPGEKVRAEIRILATDYFKGKLYENMNFIFCEGSVKIGEGRIIEISNLELKSKSN